MFDEKWNVRFWSLAKEVAEWSKDPTTAVGAVIVSPTKSVLSTGYNGFPPGVNDDVMDRYQRPEKYYWTEHAERSAMYFAAANGVSISGAGLYVTMFPCSDCARGIIRTGIVHVCAPPWREGQWAESSQRAARMLDEAGVQVTYLL